MMKTHTSFYYILWILIPVIIGVFFSWGIIWGIKIVYVTLIGGNHALATDFSLEQREVGSDGEEEKLEKYDFTRSGSVLRGVDVNILMRKIENSLPKKPTLSVTSPAYLAADLDTGEILVSKNEGKILPIASVTKLVTALVSLNNLPQDALVTITNKAVSTYGTAGGLFVGEKITTANLLYPLLLESSNDAAEALASSKNRVDFIRFMNEEVSSIGATHTTFHDASGLSSLNVSTPEDLFKIAQHIYKNKNSIFKISRKSSHTIKNHTWKNTVYFLRLDAYIGGKNGYTDEAGRTAVSLFRIQEKARPARNIAVVVLKSEDRTRDVSSIVNYVAEMDFSELNSLPINIDANDVGEDNWF